MSNAVYERMLPVGSAGRLANGWWGMVTLVMTEAALFAFLLFSYYYLAVQHGSDWLPARPPSLLYSLATGGGILIGDVLAFLADRSIARNRGPTTTIALGLAAAFGAASLYMQWLDWGDKEFTLSSSAYGSLYFVVTGFHFAHAAVGVCIFMALTLWSALGLFNSRRSAPISIGALYWYFVGGMWILVFFTFYITPRLGLG